MQFSPVACNCFAPENRQERQVSPSPVRTDLLVVGVYDLHSQSMACLCCIGQKKSDERFQGCFPPEKPLSLVKCLSLLGQ